MKKILAVLAILLLPLIGGFSTDMEFYVSGGCGVNAARVLEDDLFRTSWMYDVNASFLNFRFADKHTIGMPFVYKSYSETAWVDYQRLDKHQDFGVGLFYKYSFNKFIELLSQATFYYKDYPVTHGSLFGMDLTMELWLMPIEYVGFKIPFTMGITKDQLDFNVGIGAVIRYTKEDI